jgi:hypothetical protein
MARYRGRSGHDPSRSANASGSLWSRTWQAMLLRRGRWLDRPSGLRRQRPGGSGYGVARTDTSDCSASCGRHHRFDNRLHRISCDAEEEATCTSVPRSRFLLWIAGGCDPEQQAWRPHNVCSSGVECCGIASSTDNVGICGRSSGGRLDRIRPSNETEPFASAVDIAKR